MPRKDDGNRYVSVGFSEEEYKTLEDLKEKGGHRSLAAVLRTVLTTGPAQHSEAGVPVPEVPGRGGEEPLGEWIKEVLSVQGIFKTAMNRFYREWKDSQAELLAKLETLAHPIMVIDPGSVEPTQEGQGQLRPRADLTKRLHHNYGGHCTGLPACQCLGHKRARKEG